MKKSLVLAMAMALGVTASAYAANPFSDVPAGHWAYDSVAKLAASGVVEGYVDGSFGGDKLITRYEMAQIVAKAMAKGANVDKLAAEFSSELDTLGVRVANLEKKADNVKVTGAIRYRYVSNDGTEKTHTNDLRTRLFVNGQINDDWNYTAMIQNVQDFKNNAGEDKTSFERAYVEGKLGGLNVTAGRWDAFIANGNIYDTRADAVQAVYGKDVKLTAVAGKASDGGVADDFYAAELTGSIGVINMMAGYTEFKKVAATNADNEIWYVGGDMEIAKNLTVSGMYLESDAKTMKKGAMAGIAYKGADAAEVGSWGLWANYYKQGNNTFIAHTTDATTFADGFQGYIAGLDYTVAKNIIATVEYADTENRAETESDRMLWTSLNLTF